MKKFLIILISFILLTSCWKASSEDQIVKFWNFDLSISSDFQAIESVDALDADFDILYAYKLKYSADNDAKSSLILAKYKWESPKDKSEFFRIILNKFQREIAWTKILDVENFKKKDNIVHYFTYENYDNIFENDKQASPSHYGVQAYIFWNNNTYAVSFISSKKSDLSEFMEDVKNLKINK